MDKILITVHVPVIEENYDFFLPINLPMSFIANALQDSIVELSNGAYKKKDRIVMFDSIDGKIINQNNIVKFSGLRNGSDILII